MLAGGVEEEEEREREVVGYLVCISGNSFCSVEGYFNLERTPLLL